MAFPCNLTVRVVCVPCPNCQRQRASYHHGRDGKDDCVYNWNHNGYCDKAVLQSGLADLSEPASMHEVASLVTTAHAFSDDFHTQ